MSSKPKPKAKVIQRGAPGLVAKEFGGKASKAPKSSKGSMPMKPKAKC